MTHDNRFDALDGITARDLRNLQPGTPTVKLFQRFTNHVVRGVRWREHNGDTPTIIKSKQGARVTISIRGGAEIPHFGLGLRLETRNPEYPTHDCIFIWTLWNPKAFQAPRIPIATPNGQEKFTFSASVSNAQVQKVVLGQATASVDDGQVGNEKYLVEWVSQTQPEAAISLDLPESAMPRLFSDSQRRALDSLHC